MKLLFAVVLLFCNTVFAQDTTGVSSLESNVPVSYATAGIGYSSNIVFAGRKDSLPVPYVSPAIAYYHKTGFYAAGSFSYLTSAGENRIDLFTVSAGYVYEKKNFTASVSATKYFFSSKSNNIQSQINGYATAYVGYNFKKIFMVYTDASVTFASNPDLFLGTEISHRFYTFKDAVMITPSAYINFGTQHYYTEYYSYHTYGSGGSGRGSGNGSGSSSSQTTTVSSAASAKFKLLNYELSLPVSYSYKNFKLSATPVYSIPVSPSSITINGITTNESISNTFYWMAGIEYTF